jgi:hypothetical protein
VKADVERVVRDNIERALAGLSVDPHENPREAAAEIRARFIEHWADFAPFGVESASQLDALRVRLRRKATARAVSVDVDVDVRGTPLEDRPPPS